LLIGGLSWKLMFSVDDLRFVVTLSGSVTLAAAARNMNVTPPAVTQRLRLLEERLGVRLVNRLGRRLALTDEGLLFVQHATAILDEMEDMTDALAARRHIVSGRLRILAPLGFGRRYIARWLVFSARRELRLGQPQLGPRQLDHPRPLPPVHRLGRDIAILGGCRISRQNDTLVLRHCCSSSRK
jgi:DNA-binding transcriptional LysR family regulator